MEEIRIILLSNFLSRALSLCNLSIASMPDLRLEELDFFFLLGSDLLTFDDLDGLEVFDIAEMCDEVYSVWRRQGTRGRRDAIVG